MVLYEFVPWVPIMMCVNMCVIEAITVVVLIQKAGYIVSSPYYSYMGALSVQLKNMHLIVDLWKNKKLI